MSTVTPQATSQKLGVRDLRKLPAAQRDAILAVAAQLAEADYLHDTELTSCEAFGKDDLYGDSANSRTANAQAGRNLAG